MGRRVCGLLAVSRDQVWTDHRQCVGAARLAWKLRDRPDRAVEGVLDLPQPSCVSLGVAPAAVAPTAVAVLEEPVHQRTEVDAPPSTERPKGAE